MERVDPGIRPGLPQVRVDTGIRPAELQLRVYPGIGPGLPQVRVLEFALLFPKYHVGVTNM